MKLGLLVFCLGQSAIARSCSGPGVQRNIRQAVLFGYGSATLCIVLFVASLWLAAFNRRYLKPAGGIALLVLLHPAWTVSAARGDCGSTKVLFSMTFPALAAFLLLVQFLVIAAKPASAQD